MTGRTLARRLVLYTGLAAIGWAAAVAATGGFVLESPWLRLSSRSAIRPLLAAGLLLLVYGIGLRRHWRADLSALGGVLRPPTVAGLAALVTLAVGFAWGTRVAGGPDASGYVSQAALLAAGRLTMPAPEWVPDAAWANAPTAAAPVGYRPSVNPGRFAPVYAPGLPLLMAAFRIVGGSDAVFAVVPLLAAVAVWATYRLGARLSTPWAGASAAVLLASSPAFLVMTVQPMSDVPATACWTAALVAALAGRGATAGAAAALAILIRPNIAPLAVWPGLLLLWTGDRRPRALFAYAAGVCTAAAAIAGLNAYHYGSPLTSGYGSLGALYALDRVAPNAQRYAAWFAASQTALPAAGLLAPLVVAGVGTRARARMAAVVVGVPATVLALYLPYVYDIENWTYLRFLLPAYPPLLAGFAAAGLALAGRAPRRAAVRAAFVALAALLAAHGFRFADGRGVFDLARHDQRYARVAAYVNSLPPRSVVVSLAHSGTIHFYTGRGVLRFDALDDRRLDAAMSHLERRGYALFLAGDGFEIDIFRRHFAGTRAAAKLDERLGADLGGAYVYDLTATD